MKPAALSICLAALFLAACTAPGPEEVTATQSPLPSPTNTSLPSPTLSPTPTPSPTLTPTPTRTPTLTPTPLPEGYHSFDTAGFALVVPEGWQIVEEIADTVTLEHRLEDLFFFGSSEIQEMERSPEESRDILLEGVIQEFGFILVDRQELLLSDGVILYRLSGNVINEDGANMTMQFGLALKSRREYTFIAIGPQAAFGEQRGAIDSLYASIELLGAHLYGAQRDEALVLMGGEPEPDDLDPARQLGGADDYAGHLFSGLVRLSPQLQIEPDLAESWTVSPDGTVYTFHLREGLIFQSGRPLTAHDVQYSWERAADPALDSPTTATYLGDIVGVADRLAGEADDIRGVVVLDDATLEVRLDSPKPYFLAKLTYPASFVVDRENVAADPEGWMFHPNASGPFTLKEYHEEQALVFERNPAYHAPAGLSHVIYLLYRAGPDVGYFEVGEIDIAYPNLSDLERALDPGDPLNEQLHTTTSLCTRLLSFSNTTPPMDDPAVRRAFALAIDRENILELIYENRVLPAVTILPPAMPGFSADLTGTPFDPEAARQALAGSSYAGDLPEIFLTYPGYGDSDSPFANALASMWEEILGVHVRIEYLDPDNYPVLAREEHGHIVSHGWCADYPDPQNFLDILYHSDSEFNYAGYANPEVDALLEAARTDLDPAHRLERYHQIEARLLDDYVVLPVMHWINYTLVSSELEGFVDTPIGVAIVDRITRKQEN